MKYIENCPEGLINNSTKHQGTHNPHITQIAAENRVCRNVVNSFHMSRKYDAKKRQGQYKKGILQASLISGQRCKSSK